MRTTVILDEDVAAALERVRREGSVGLSRAVNDLIRAGLRESRERREFEQRSEAIGLRVDVRNVAEAIDLLEGEGAG